MSYIVYVKSSGNQWKELKRFSDPKQADQWLTSYIKVHGFTPSDFTIVRK